ncbi:MAG TPA: alpha-amylase family glycosyl hydrolase, partial [Bacteroidota bacterium]
DRTLWKPVAVPAFWESYPGLKGYDGWGWFYRTFRARTDQQPLSIYFAGVDNDAVIWVNGIEVGSHTGHHDPFAVDIGSAVVKGENRLVVLVKDHKGAGGIYRPVTLVATKRLDDVLRGPYSARRARKSAPWVQDAVIYSVYLRSASPEGTFSGLERRIPELKAMGVTVLWLLPIHPVGEKRRKGTLGSPYAVRDYYGINPEFGTMADFKHLLTTVHKSGLKLIIDMVANHTAWDSKLIREHPDWFTKDSSGAIVSPNADWTDVADLDYTKPGLRKYMSDMMVWWVKEVGVDGFRCDVSELVPTDFWERVRSRLDRLKPVMMLSEGSIPEHHVKAFDLTYSWNVYDQLLPMLSGQRPASTIDSLLHIEELQFPRGSLRMRFTTNHDKNAWDAPAVEKFGTAGLKAATVLVNTMPGVPMMYTGEEVANDRRLALFEKVGVDWTRPRWLAELDSALFHLRRTNRALAHGSFLKLKSDHDKQVYAFLRKAGRDRLLVVINMQERPVEAAFQVPASERAGLKKMKEMFGQDALPSLASGSAALRLTGYSYRVYTSSLP